MICNDRLVICNTRLVICYNKVVHVISYNKLDKKYWCGPFRLPYKTVCLGFTYVVNILPIKIFRSKKIDPHRRH